MTEINEEAYESNLYYFWSILDDMIDGIDGHQACQKAKEDFEEIKLFSSIYYRYGDRHDVTDPKESREIIQKWCDEDRKYTFLVFNRIGFTLKCIFSVREHFYSSSIPRDIDVDNC